MVSWALIQHLHSLVSLNHPDAAVNAVATGCIHLHMDRQDSISFANVACETTPATRLIPPGAGMEGRGAGGCQVSLSISYAALLGVGMNAEAKGQDPEAWQQLALMDLIPWELRQVEDMNPAQVAVCTCQP